MIPAVAADLDAATLNWVRAQAAPICQAHDARIGLVRPELPLTIVVVRHHRIPATAPGPINAVHVECRAHGDYAYDVRIMLPITTAEADTSAPATP